MKSDSLDDIRSLQETGSSTVELLLSVLHDDQSEYSEVWRGAKPRLEQYTEKFATEWSVVGDRILSRPSGLVNRQWAAEKIVVCFVECLYGGFGWVDTIALTPVPRWTSGRNSSRTSFQNS